MLCNHRQVLVAPLLVLRKHLTTSAMSDLNIENTNIKTASGVSLDEHQKTLVGSVLDVGTLP